MKIFITGAEGFIGSHLVEHLLEKNYKLKCLYQYNSLDNKGWLQDIKYNKKIQLISGDVRDYQFIVNEIKDCDVVIHLAALIAIPYSYKSPFSYLETNIKGTLNVLEACRVNKIKKLICTSTSEVYGTAVKVPITENHRLLGQSPYAASKIAADQLATSYFCSFGLPVTILRPFNTFGPRQSLRAVIPTIINQAINNTSYLDIGSTNTTRDFNYIKDITKAFEKCLNTKKDVGEIINIGSGYEISINDLAKTIYKLLEKKLVVKKNQKRFRPKSSEVFRLCADNKKAKKFLNWSPQYNKKKGLEKALIETINWYKNPKNKKLFLDKKYII